MRSKRWPLPSRTHIRTRRNEARPVGEDAGPVPPDGGSEVGSVGGLGENPRPGRGLRGGEAISAVRRSPPALTPAASWVTRRAS